MSSRNQTKFLACAIANGLASLLALASAIAGHWIVAITAFVASIVVAGGMMKTLAELRSSR